MAINVHAFFNRTIFGVFGRDMVSFNVKEKTTECLIMYCNNVCIKHIKIYHIRWVNLNFNFTKIECN